MKDERIYLGHIRDAIQDIQDYAAPGREAFMAERMRQDAVLREAERDGDVRFVDESGEDYLFSADRLIAIDVPAAVKASLLKASR